MDSDFETYGLSSPEDYYGILDEIDSVEDDVDLFDEIDTDVSHQPFDISDLLDGDSMEDIGNTFIPDELFANLIHLSAPRPKGKKVVSQSNPLDSIHVRMQTLETSAESDADTVKDFVQLLAQLVRLPPGTGKGTLDVAKTFHVVHRCLNEHKHNTEIAVEICQLVDKYCRRDPDMRSLLALEIGFLKLFCDMLLSVASADLVGAVCRTLGRLCFEVENVQYAAGTNGAVRCLSTVLEEYSDSEAVVEAAAKALANICFTKSTENGRQAVADHNMDGMIIRLISACASVDTICALLHALSVLVSNVEVVIKTLFEDNRLLEIFRVCTEHITSASTELIHSVCSFLKAIGTGGGSFKLFSPASSTALLQLVQRFLQMHEPKHDKRLLEVIADFLQTASDNGKPALISACGQLSQLGIIAEIVEAVKRHRQSAVILKLLCRILEKIVDGSKAGFDHSEIVPNRTAEDLKTFFNGLLRSPLSGRVHTARGLLVKLTGQAMPPAIDSDSNDEAPLEDIGIPAEILARGPAATSSYRRLLKKGTTRVRDSRLYLCGEEGVGKTSLRKTILGEDFNPNEVSTRGIATTPSIAKCTYEVHRWTVEWHSDRRPKQRFSELTEDVDLLNEMMKILQEEKRRHQAEQKTAREAIKKKKKEKKQQVQLLPLPPKEPPKISSPLSEASHRHLTAAEPRLKKPDTHQLGDMINIASGKSEGKLDGLVPHATVALGKTRVAPPVDSPPDPVTKTVQEVNKEFGEVPDELTHLIAQLLDDPAIMDTLEEVIRVSIWDFAGQSVYYAIHHIFMTYVRSIYLLTFRSDKNLNEGAAPLIRDTFKPGKRPKPEQMTHLDYIRQWLAAVHFTLRRNQVASSSSAVLPVNRGDISEPPLDLDVNGETSVPPHVVFVGTFADRLKTPLKDESNLWEALSGELALLDEGCHPHPAFHHVSRPDGCHIHLIDNTQSQRGRPPTKEVHCLQKHIAQLARRTLAQSELIPRSWVCFERAIQRLVEKDQHMLTIASTRRILKEVCDISEEGEVHLLLQFLCDKGEIAVLNPAQPLEREGRCVLNMQWLINRISEVITVRPRKDRRVKSLHYAEWGKLEESGILSGKLINHMWSGARLETSDQELLVDFMTSRDLMYEIIHDAQPGKTELFDREFIVPSLINKVADVDKFIRGPLVRTPGVKIFSMDKVPLFFVAESGGNVYPIPHSMYFRMVVRCLRCWPKDFKLQYNCARLHITDSPHQTDVILCHNAVRGTIKVVVQRFITTQEVPDDNEEEAAEEEAAEEDEEQNAQKTMSKVCCDVRTHLQGILDNLREVYFPGLTIGTAITCPNDHGPCMRHKDENCRLDACVVLIQEHKRLPRCPTEGTNVRIPDNALCWTDKKVHFDRRKTKLRRPRKIQQSEGNSSNTAMLSLIAQLLRTNISGSGVTAVPVGNFIASSGVTTTGTAVQIGGAALERATAGAGREILVDGVKYILPVGRITPDQVRRFSEHPHVVSKWDLVIKELPIVSGTRKENELDDRSAFNEDDLARFNESGSKSSAVAAALDEWSEKPLHTVDILYDVLSDDETGLDLGSCLREILAEKLLQ